jgi:hypothetical protein
MFKKVIKWFFRITVLLLSFVVVLIVGTYLYFSLSWRNYYSEEEMTDFVQLINESPKMTEEFYGIYDQIRKDRHDSMLRSFVGAFVSERARREKNFYYKAALAFVHEKKPPRLNDLRIAFALESLTSSEKCFDFYMNQSDKYVRSVYPNLRSITELKDTTEVLSRIILMRSPSYYRSYPEKVGEGVARFKEQLNNED